MPTARRWSLSLPETVDLKHAPARSARSRMTSGTDAMALGVAAAGALAERPVFYCSYPITPASALLHALAKLKAGVRTFQAEDEIAAACAAIGASYAGGLGFTASSGPGLSLKTEALGLAVTAELPLVVIDVQRAGPSTGMPTKPEQSDLDMAIFGRHGESPLPVLAPATPGDCFDIVIDAARIAIEAMTPVIVLSDAYLANAISDWEMPSIDDLQPVRSAQRRKRRRPDHRLHPRSRDARPPMGRAGHAWPRPSRRRDREGLGQREHLLRSGQSSRRWCGLRAEKIARVARPQRPRHDPRRRRGGRASGRRLGLDLRTGPPGRAQSCRDRAQDRAPASAPALAASRRARSSRSGATRRSCARR